MTDNVDMLGVSQPSREYCKPHPKLRDKLGGVRSRSKMEADIHWQTC